MRVDASNLNSELFEGVKQVCKRGVEQESMGQSHSELQVIRNLHALGVPLVLVLLGPLLHFVLTPAQRGHAVPDLGLLL